MTASRTKVRVVQPLGRDEYEVFVVRYEWADYDSCDTHVRPLLQQYLDEDGNWVEFQPGFEIRPALRISGWLDTVTGLIDKSVVQMHVRESVKDCEAFKEALRAIASAERD